MKPPSNERVPTTWPSSEKKPEADDLFDIRKPLKEDDPRRNFTFAHPVKADSSIKDPPTLSSVIVSVTTSVLEA